MSIRATLAALLAGPNYEVLRKAAPERSCFRHLPHAANDFGDRPFYLGPTTAPENIQYGCCRTYVIWWGHIHNNHDLWGTGFFVGSDTIFTSLGNLSPGMDEITVERNAFCRQNGRLLANNNDVALIKLEDAVPWAAPLSLAKVDPTGKDEYYWLNGYWYPFKGYCGCPCRWSSQQVICRNDQGGFHIELRYHGGLLGSPIVNPEGEVVAMVTKHDRLDKPSLVTASILRQMLLDAVS